MWPNHGRYFALSLPRLSFCNRWQVRTLLDFTRLTLAGTITVFAENILAVCMYVCVVQLHSVTFCDYFYTFSI